MGQSHKVGGADETGEYAVVASHVNQCNHLHACMHLTHEPPLVVPSTHQNRIGII